MGPKKRIASGEKRGLDQSPDKVKFCCPMSQAISKAFSLNRPMFVCVSVVCLSSLGNRLYDYYCRSPDLKIPTSPKKSG